MIVLILILEEDFLLAKES